MNSYCREIFRPNGQGAASKLAISAVSFICTISLGALLSQTASAQPAPRPDPRPDARPDARPDPRPDARPPGGDAPAARPGGIAKLGIATLDPDSNDGFHVDRIQDRSPAASAGIRVGDVIIGVDNSPVRDMAALQQVLGPRQPGDQIPVKIRRGQEEFMLAVILGEQARPAARAGNVIAGNPANGPANIPADGPRRPAADDPRPAGTVDAMRNYLELVEQYSRMTRDPVASGVAAVVNSSDVLRGRPLMAIEYFSRILPEVQNEAVARTIRLQLIDLYKVTNQPERALEQLQRLMIEAPPGNGAMAPGGNQPSPQPARPGAGRGNPAGNPGDVPGGQVNPPRNNQRNNPGNNPGNNPPRPPSDGGGFRPAPAPPAPGR